MSYFIDPWLFNCRNNPADSPAEQAEQRTIIEATQRALDYAHQHGVTLIAAAGNENTNLAQVTSDGTSPDYPPGTEHTRTIDNNCLDLPAQGNNVIACLVGRADEGEGRLLELRLRQDHRLGPGRLLPRRSVEPVDDTRRAQRAGIPNLILAAYPKNVADELGELNPTGRRTPRSSSATAAAARARTTSGSRARRWPRRTPWASPP